MHNNNNNIQSMYEIMTSLIIWHAKIGWNEILFLCLNPVIKIEHGLDLMLIRIGGRLLQVQSDLAFEPKQL